MGQEIFEKAKAAYKDSIVDLAKMAGTLEKIMKVQGKDYDSKLLLMQFDIVLQYSMLQVVLADGRIIPSELCFIRDIVQHADICEFLSKLGQKAITWEDIYKAGPQVVQIIVDDMHNSIEELSEEFVAVFAAYDASSQYDYFSDLEKNILNIILATCQADGKIDMVEIKNRCMIFGVLYKIKHCLGIV